MAALSRIYALLPSQLISPLYSLCPRSAQPLAISQRLLSSKPNLDNFEGEWIENRKQSFEELARAAGIQEYKISEVAQSKTKLSYHKIGDDWLIVEHTEGQLRKDTSYFTFGKRFIKSSNLLNVDLSCVIEKEGNKMIEHCELPNRPGMELITQREVNGGEMLSTTTLGKVTMTQHFLKKLTLGLTFFPTSLGDKTA